MSILQHDIPGARVADLCAGSGALGLEALSRGAAFCDFVDLADVSIRAIRENATTLGALDRFVVHRADAVRFVQRAPAGEWDIAFADPPYHLGIAARLATAWLERPYARVLSVEHDVHEVLPPGGERRVYGSTGVTIYRGERAERSPDTGQGAGG